MSQDTKSAVKLDQARASANAEKATQAAIDAGARAGNAAAQTTARISQAAAQASASMGQTAANAAANQASNMTNEFTRWFSDIKMPTMTNVQALTDFNRRNFESFSNFVRIGLEGFQSIVRRQMELMQQASRDLTEATNLLGAQASSDQLNTGARLETIRSRYEAHVSNLRELQELARRSSNESFDVLNRRICEALGEMKVMIENCQSQSRPV